MSASHLPVPRASGVDLAGLLALYDANRYLDAYRATEGAWHDPTAIERLSPLELIHAGRLAGRLGSDKLRRHLHRRALALAPDLPVVRYYARYARRLEPPLAQLLRDFEREPVLAGADPGLAASWLATHAHMYGCFRDFDRAHELIREAKRCGAERAWVSYCEGEILLGEDRWQEALDVAEEAWRRARGMPALASLLARALSKTGRLAEAAERLVVAAREVQSYETLGTALWYLCATAEQADSAERHELAAQAYRLSDRLWGLAPLADRGTRSYIARARTDAAMLLGDRVQLAREAAEVHEPFFRAVVDNLARRPRGERRLLPIRRVYQKHLGCFPASVAAAAGAFGVSIDEDALSAELTYDGTAAWRILEWLRGHGFVAAPFVLTPGLARSLVGAGIPFVYLTEGLTSSHATVAMGLDEACGTLLIHDPSATRWDQVLVDKLDEGEAPFGPEAIAFVPTDRRALLDLVPAASREPFEAFIEHRRTVEQNGAGAARAIVDALARRYPDHPFTRRLEALQRSLEGDVHGAIAGLQRLLDENPQSVPLRRELLQSLRQTGNAAETRRLLADIVERGQLPGIRTRESWRSPPATYLVQYADYLGVPADRFAQAERLLWKAARQDPYLAETYHVLGDVLSRSERHDESRFAYRLAVALSAENEHYARALADSVRRDDEEEAIALLRARVERLGTRIEGQHAWITWIDALEDYGRPEEAMAAMRDAQARRPDDAVLCGYATKFWVRMGDWAEAERSLAAVERGGHRGLYLEAAVSFLRSAGRWREALPLCEEWVREAPDRLEARRALLRLHAMASGQHAARDVSARFARERPGHDDLEQLYYEQLRDVFDSRGAEALLRSRVARNPDDVWAWRELGHSLVDVASLRRGAERDAVLDELASVRAAVARLAPDVPSTLVLEGRYEHCRGHDADAVDLVLRALEIDPSFSYCYGKAWEWSEPLPAEAQRRCLEALERSLLRGVGFAVDARRLAFDVARRHGLEQAEAAVARWRRERPDDPEVIEAAADLLLEYGQGTRDAERAVELLVPAVRRFPAHLDLAFSLAHAYGVLLREDDEIAVLRDLVRRQPLNGGARRGLARVLAHRGEVDEAVRVLRDGAERDPLDEDVAQSLATLQWDFGRHDDAVATLERALASVPESVAVRESLIERLLDAGAGARAVEVARAGVVLYPEGAYAWYLLARALDRAGLGATPSEAEESYLTALRHNPELYEAASGLSGLLASRRRFDEARAVIEAQIPHLADPSPAHARLAWLTREAGRKDEARREMADVVARWPQSRWAFSTWLDWVEDDEAYAEAKERLETIDRTLLETPRYAARRLALLELAGSPKEGLAAEWERLLADFPQELELHLRRFDVLAEAEAWGDARSVLERVERFHPFSAYLLARKVAVLAHAKELDAALTLAARVWQLPGDDEEWPEQRVWQELASAGAEKRAAETVLDLVLSGKRVRRAVAKLLVDHVELVRLPGERAGWRRHLRPSRRRTLLALLDALSRHAWDDGSCRAAALVALADLSRRSALAYWRANRERCGETTALWQAAGSVLARFGLKYGRELRSWMRAWRERSGVEMWAVANYSQSLRRLPRLVGAGEAEDLEELNRTSRDALDHLAHDWVAQYHAAVLCETSLRLGRDQEFLSSADRYEDVLADRDRSYWQPAAYAWAPALMLLFRELLRAEGSRAVREACRRLVAARVPARARWVAREWSRRVRGRVSWAYRAWLRVVLVVTRPAG